MAVKLIRGGDPNLPWEYVGLAADAKPTTGVPAGSTFLEADTAIKSMFSGTTWYPPKSEMEGYGATVATRPLATAVPIGYAFQSVATQEIWQSDGTNWVVV